LDFLRITNLRKYWITLLKKAGLQVLIDRTIKWKTSVPKEVLGNIIKNIIEEWKHLGVEHKYIESIENILHSNKEFK